MSPRLASDALPFVVVFVIAVLVAALAYLCHMARRQWKRLRAALRRTSLRARLRESRRLGWYLLTKRMPRYRGRPGDRRLRPDVDEAVEFGRIAGLIKQRGIFGDDPQRDRRLP